MRLKSGNLKIAVSLTSLAIIVVLSLGMVISLPVSHATSEPAYCSTIGGAWDGVSTCTLTTSYFASSGNLEVASGTSLVLNCSNEDCLDLELNGTMTVDAGATMDLSGSVTCSSCAIQILIDLDGSGAGITNFGTINIDPSLSCSDPSRGTNCWGVDNDLGTISNYGTISIAGNYTCSNGDSCYGVYNAGTINDVCGGTLSPTTSPEFNGFAVATISSCTTTVTATSTLTTTETTTATFTDTTTATSVSPTTTTETTASTSTATVTSTSVSTSTIFVYPTTTHVSCYPSTARVGHEVDCVAIVKSSNSLPTGTISFGWTEGKVGAISPPANCVPVGGSTTRCSETISFNFPKIGTVVVTAAYSGDETHQSSHGATLVHVIK
jgi:hypothetical protein